jgi:hypothetical protein
LGGKQGVVDGAQLVARNDDDLAAEPRNHIANRITVAEGNEKTSGTFD